MIKSLRSLLAAHLMASVAFGMLNPAFAQAPAPETISPMVAESPDSGTMKRADKDMLRVLQKMQDLGVKPTESRTVAEARMQPTPADAAKAILKEEGKDPVALMAAMQISKKDMTYPVEGGTQPVRIYTPEGNSSEPRPLIVYYHGGGWVIADIDTYEASAMALAKKSNAIVVSVEYRHAPENKFPAAHQDAFAAYKWVLANAGKFGGDPAKTAVVGESAGGNLAANVAIMARDEKTPMPVQMVLVYPVAGTDLMTPSYVANQNAIPLSKAAIGWFFNNTLAKPEDAKNPMLNLTTMADLKGLPPTTIINAEIDPLASDGELLGDKLKAAGVKTSRVTYKGVTHEFFGLDAVVNDAKTAQDVAARDLKSAFGSR